VKGIVYVVISCDADPDRPAFGGIPLNQKKEHKWLGLEVGIPKLKKATKHVKDRFSNGLRITWFIRSDTQMYDIYGDYSWPAKNFKDMWTELDNEEDEIGWHPHMWRWSEKYNIWFQERSDDAWIKNCLLEGYSQLKNVFGVKTTRMGWDFHNNLTMNTLNDLGISADLSALPGFKGERFVDKTLGLYHDCFDWIGSPSEPYHPSSSNYKANGNLAILEIPHSCFHQNNFIYTTKRVVWKTPFRRFMQKKPRKSYALMSSLDPMYFYDGVMQVFKKAKSKPQILVSYFHPDDLLDEKGREGFPAIIKNLNTISNLSKEFNIDFKFITAKEAAAIANESIVGKR